MYVDTAHTREVERFINAIYLEPLTEKMVRLKRKQ